VAILVVSLLLAACGSQDPRTDPKGLEGVAWVLDSDSTGSLVDPAPSDARVDIRFQDGELRGNSGCNTYGGPYEADGDGSISFGAMSVTAMACVEEPRMALESAYLQALGTVSGFQLTDGGLVLTGGAVALTFTASSSSGAAVNE
jgi:heat shock protein HslJ